jgi:RNA polymerase sigma-70 factor (ECF subfamily)
VTVIRLHAHGPNPEAGELPAVPRAPPRELPTAAEAELALMLAEGDPESLDQLIRWFWEPLASYAYRLVADRDAAMDIAQETFVILWEGRERIAPRSLRAYLFRITRNRALDQLKTRRTRRRLLKSYDAHRSRPATPEDVFERDRVSDQVELAIRTLPERRREVFVLAYLKGLSYSEVADVLGISPKTVQNQMSAALSQLRELLSPLIRERRSNAEENETTGIDVG